MTERIAELSPRFKARMAGVVADIAGRVEAVGNNVTQFQPGDEVFGGYAGGFAEYASVPENRLALKPANSSFEEAATAPVAALTALQGLRDNGLIQPGQQVLIQGASGQVWGDRKGSPLWNVMGFS